MKCQILFSGKNKKNILKCRLLQILPRVLSVKHTARTNSILCVVDFRKLNATFLKKKKI